jgi:hypothetical protein
MSTSRILDLCRTGRITPAQVAMLMQLRRELAWRPRPWWERACVVLWRAMWA